jgi:hypothetical protein
MTTPERLDPDWARYPETVLVFDQSDLAVAEGEARLRVDLRAPISDEVRAALDTLGL